MTTPRHKLPVYLKLNQMAPNTHGHNIVVQVVNKKTTVDKTDANGRRVRQQQVLVADDTGAMYLNAHNVICDKLTEGKVVELHDVRVKLFNNCMRLTMDKWASVNETFKAIPQKVQTDPNFSHVVYQQLCKSHS
ncbi:hypothetical protein BWQ96_00243 [Gracilariopsis chorda]|uniref:Single-stranded DNA binding protein Ssb-like OB fold domain-containing protein n=1 Tax=Gracilariopsis chorda TaxID=448386 RepID=A0A2V3J710_9FLOR|nr:hypothetical protein BWQ96_00243 [Gracilariopsis chorda]|eukprot:PXF50083.1 hypothetical protein BWQ96_00243 [Gracilariopsis chorda]